jgi:hypothetical protein
VHVAEFDGVLPDFRCDLVVHEIATPSDYHGVTFGPNPVSRSYRGGI